LNKEQIMQPVETIYSKLQGVTRTNRDGSQRQDVIAELCYQGQQLLLMRAPNQYSHNNLDVYVAYQVGQVNPELADLLAPILDEGRVVRAHITEITGGTEDKPTRGVNVSFTIYE
jgi:single-stranded-DNA-specific exonuclease